MFPNSEKVKGSGFCTPLQEGAPDAVEVSAPTAAGGVKKYYFLLAKNEFDMFESDESYPSLRYPEAVILSSGSSLPAAKHSPQQTGEDHRHDDHHDRIHDTPTTPTSYARKLCTSLYNICLKGATDEEDRKNATTTRDYFFTSLRHVFLGNIPYPGTDEFRADSKFVPLRFIDTYQ